MQIRKHNLILGSILFAFLAGFVLYERADYLANPRYGMTLLVFSLTLSTLAGLAVALAPNMESPKYRPKLYTCWVIFVLLLAPLVMIAAIERLNGNFLWDLYSFAHVTDNYAVALVLYLLVFALTGSVRISVLSLSPVLLLFGIANMYVKEFKGSPLLPMDAGGIATAAKVADQYDYSIGFEIAFAVVLTAFIMALAVHLAMPKREKSPRAILRVSMLVVLGLVIGVFYGTEVPVKLGMRPDFFNQTRGYEGRGALREFFNNSRYIWLREPAGYDVSTLEEEVAAYIERKTAENGGTLPRILPVESDTAATAGAAAASDTSAGSADSTTNPDIIVVMNESFADLSSLGEFSTSEAVLPNLAALQKESLYGNVYVSVRGTGTSNTEYEVLTGNSMAFLPAGSNAYQLYVKGEQPGLVSYLKARGYEADASHPYFAANWNRPKVYDYMGFDEYIAMEDMFMDEVDAPAQAYLKGESSNRGMLVGNLRRLYPDELSTVGGYISDHLGYKKLEAAYEARDRSKPYFHFHVTMQNHSPYQNTFGNFPSEVSLEDLSGRYPKAEHYLTRIKASDEALGELVDYYRNADRPVILLFFGDHQPIVESDFFSEITGEPIDEWSDEKTQELYQTPFLIWANYDIPTGEVDAISANYLQVLLMESAGLPLTEYEQFLACLYQDYPIITAQGCRDAAGHFFLAEDGAPSTDASAETDTSTSTGAGSSADADTPSSSAEAANTTTDPLTLYERLSYNSVADRANHIKKLFAAP